MTLSLTTVTLCQRRTPGPGPLHWRVIFSVTVLSVLSVLLCVSLCSGAYFTEIAEPNVELLNKYQLNTGSNQYTYSRGHSLVLDDDGNAYLTGKTTAAIATTHSNGVSNSDVFVIKFNSSLDQQWIMTAGSNSVDSNEALTVLRNGHLMVAFDVGTRLTNPVATYGTDGGCCTLDFGLFYINSTSGEVIWALADGGTSSEQTAGVVELSNGDIVVIGNTRGNYAGTNPDTSTNDIAAFSFSMTTKDFNWRTQLGLVGHDYPQALVADSNDDLYFVAYVESNLKSGYTSLGGRDAYVRKVDKDNGYIWDTQYGRDQDDIPHAAALLPNGDLILAGSTESEWSGFTKAGTGDRDAWLVRLDGTTGTPSWYWAGGGNANDQLWAVAVNSAGDIISSGITHRYVYNADTGDYDGVLTKHSPDGDLIYVHQYTGTIQEEDEFPYDIAINEFDHVLVGGYTNSGLDGFTTGSVWDAFVLQFNDTNATVPIPPPECVLEDATCAYQPPTPVLNYSAVVVEQGLALYRITLHASEHYDAHFKVVFDNSDNFHCDYPKQTGSDGPGWTKTVLDSDACMAEYTTDVPLSDFLGKCGFEQVRSTLASVTFAQTVSVQASRTCEDGRETRTITHESQFPIELTSPNTVTANITGLQVFGTALALDLLGDLTVAPNIDTNMPAISGEFITSVQYPYELQEPVVVLNGDFNESTWVLTGTYCTADPQSPQECQQTWSYSFEPNEACPTKSQLEGELVTVAWNVNCSIGFDGECAPAFESQPEATFSLSSPNYCFSEDGIQLTPSLEVYSFDELTSNVADFGAASLGTLSASNGFEPERTFTAESTLYAEFTVLAEGTGVQLTDTVLVRAVSQHSTRGNLVLFDTESSTQVATFVVHDTGFGIDESSTFANTRSRFQFQWINGTTVLLDSTPDVAQTVALVATTVSTFTNVQSLRDHNLEDHPVLGRLNREVRSKEAMHMHSRQQQQPGVALAADDTAGPRSARTAVLAQFVPASSNPTGPATSSSASTSQFSAFGGTTGLIAVVAGCAVAVLVVLAIVRRGGASKNKNSSSLQTETQSGEIHSSSCSNLNSFTLGQRTSSDVDSIALSSVAAAYTVTE
jgi:hypothetical protein